MEGALWLGVVMVVMVTMVTVTVGVMGKDQGELQRLGQPSDT